MIFPFYYVILAWSILCNIVSTLIVLYNVGIWPNAHETYFTGHRIPTREECA
jgi:hypothetical protein